MAEDFDSTNGTPGAITPFSPDVQGANPSQSAVGQDASPTPDQTPQAQQPQPGQQPGTSQGPQGANQGPGQGQDQGQGQGQQKQLNAPKMDAPKPAQATQPPNPLAQKANWLKETAQILSGGQRYTTHIDANTGELTRTPVATSGKDMMMAIALEAVSGAMAGLSVAPGPGNLGRAAGAGYAEQMNIQQQRQAQQSQEADDNYVRAASIANTNFKMHENALRLGQMDKDYNQQFVNDHAEALGNLDKVGAIKAQHVIGSDLLDKYHITKDQAIPDGLVKSATPNKDGSDHWEPTYSVIDPEAKMEIPQDTAKMLAEYHVPGWFTMKDGKATPINLPSDATARAKFVIDGMAAANSIKLTEDNVNKQFSSLNDPGEAQQFDVNLRKALDSGAVTPKALAVFAKYTSLPLDQVRAAMEKDHVDPNVVGQVTSLLPSDAMDKLKNRRDVQSALAKNTADIKTRGEAEGIINSADATPEQKASANAWIKDDDHRMDQQSSRQIHKEVAAAGAAETARKTAEYNFNKTHPDAKGAGNSSSTGSDATKNLSHPELADIVANDKNYDENGVNHAFMDAMMKIDPGRARLVKALAEGRELSSHYGLAKEFGGSLAADVQSYNKNFNVEKVREYAKNQEEMGANGKLGRGIIAGSTAFEHMGRLYDSMTPQSMIPGTAWHGKKNIAAQNSTHEMANFYASGFKPDKESVDGYRKSFEANPIEGRAAIKESMNAMMDKMEETYNQHQNSLPSGFIRPEPFLSRRAAKEYTRVTGNKVDPRLVGNVEARTHIDGTQVQSIPQGPPSGSAGTATFGGVPYYVDANGRALGKVAH